MKIRPSFISEELELVDAFNCKAEALISDLIRNLEDHIQTVPIENGFGMLAKMEKSLWMTSVI